MGCLDISTTSVTANIGGLMISVNKSVVCFGTDLDACAAEDPLEELQELGKAFIIRLGKDIRILLKTG